MTVQNDFTPFATGAGANTLSVTALRALTSIVGQGVQAGVARSDVANTVWRQSSFMCAMIGEFIKDAGYDALDNGDVDALEANFIAALRHTLLSQDTALLHFGVDSGTANHIILATPSPVVAAIADGLTLLFIPAATNTGATDLVVGSFGAIAVKKDNGTTALAKGDLVAGRLAIAVVYSGVARLLCQVPDVAVWHQGSATGGTSTAMTTDLSPVVGVLVPHLKMRVPISTTNGNAPTLDFGFGAKPIVQNTTGVALTGGEMPGSVGFEADLQWDGTSLRLLNGIGASTPNVVGCDDTHAGVAGLVPAPPAASQRKVVLGTGIWGDIPVMVGASVGAGGKLGAVPAPAAGDQGRFLRGDGTWADAGDPWGTGIGAIVTVGYVDNTSGVNVVGKTVTASGLIGGTNVFSGVVENLYIGTCSPAGSGLIVTFGVGYYLSSGGGQCAWSDSRRAAFAGSWMVVNQIAQFGSASGGVTGVMVLKRVA